ncbi:Pyrophosphate--fructose 6-phosphate 1-phosphotransferase subunit alpha [Capsicum annuum]|nr:Pyrophosphate--fructose 6-phosphate 1-phosphotransferase subunit alpha [Capsicum annuum]
MDADYGIPRQLSDLQKLRSQYQPELPPCLQGTTVRVELRDATTAADPFGEHTIKRFFPHTYGQPLAHFLRATAKVPDAQIITEHPAIRVGVVFCGRQSPGGHNVIWGLHDALKVHNRKNILLGFLGGSEGLFAQKTLEITDDVLATYKNQGGYDMLGRTKDQIRTTEQVNAAMDACKTLKLDGLVIIGGVTSNTDAAHLAEKFAETKCPTKVVGVPVTLNGDLKNQFVEANVGFDTICKAEGLIGPTASIFIFFLVVLCSGISAGIIPCLMVNSQLISNVCTDALSAEKVILGEEVAASKLTIFDITQQICDAVQARAEHDKNHGVILLPEGLIESIPEVYALLQEIHGLLRQGVSSDKISSQLSPWASALFDFLPHFIRKQLLLHPESDDSAQLSQIETEKLIAHLVETEMNKRLKEGTYKGKKFNAICHFFGYQARGSLPSKFDCDYAYVLGHICYHILAARLNGYMATVTNLKNPANKWHCGAAPISAMMTVKRYGRGAGQASIGVPALHPATVDLKGRSYELLSQNATKFLLDDVYRNPGPLQFDGPGADAKAVTLCVEDQDYMGRIKKLQEYLDKVRAIVKPGCSQDVLKAALSAMASVTDILSVISSPSSASTPF